MIKAVIFDFWGTLASFSSSSDHHKAEETQQVLRVLKESGYKIGLLSNATSGTAKEVIRRGFDAFIDESIYCLDHGFAKPDAKAFEVILEKLDVKPEEAVMIGDSPDGDIQGAEAVGMKAILCKGSLADLPEKIKTL